MREETARAFLGGVGLAAKVIFSEIRRGIDPLSPDNRLIFAVGPFNGTTVPGSGRWCVAGKSPLTGIWGEACGGGHWGPEFKRTGHDALVVHGKANNPVYLFIRNEEVEIREGSHLWGKDTFEAEDALKKELKEPNVKVACIGPAGERLVRMSCIVSDKGHGVAARSGLGAVMGSKNLKAVAVVGTTKVGVWDSEKLNRLVKPLPRKIASSAKDFHDHGTAFYPASANELGDLPIKYWRQGEWKQGAERIGAPNYTKKLLAKPMACSYCPVGCHRYVEVRRPKKYVTKGMGPEYESLAMLGSLCLVDNLEAIVKANDICNRFGLDTISAGGIVGFLMECCEMGWTTREDLDGIDLHWGDADSMITLVKKIAKREGIGDLLAEGIRPLSERIGKGATELAVHVKGQDIPGHDPRAFVSMAVQYATSNRGACHLRGAAYNLDFGVTIPEAGIGEKPKDRFSAENRGYVAAKFQDHCALFDSLVQCKFMAYGGLTVTDQVNLLNAITGWEMEAAEFLRIGERIYNLQRAFNVREGISRKDDRLPKRMFEHTKSGGHAGIVPNLGPMLDEYYRVRGWDNDGKPTEEKLVELGLTETLKAIQE